MHQGVVPGRPASHGCSPSGAFAKRLWGITKVGARVTSRRRRFAIDI
jgi:hypothetical protein